MLLDTGLTEYWPSSHHIQLEGCMYVGYETTLDLTLTLDYGVSCPIGFHVPTAYDSSFPLPCRCFYQPYVLLAAQSQPQQWP